MHQERSEEAESVEIHRAEASDEKQRPSTVGGLPYPVPASGRPSFAVRKNPSRDTRPEQRVRSRLHRDGWRFRKNFSIQVSDRRVRPDIVFSRQRVAIFVDGCFWHRCPLHGASPTANSAYWGPKLDRNVVRDRTVDQLLTAAGWTVVRVWEHESPEAAAKSITTVLREASMSQIGGRAGQIGRQ